VAATASVGSAVAGGIASNDAADAANANAAAQDRFNEQTYETQLAYQKKLEAYQDDTWQQDVDFATKTLAYQENEFNRQEVWAGDATKAVVTNEANAENQQLLKTVQQNVALSLQESDVMKQAQGGEASAATGAAGRNVTGNSVDQVIQDVARQGGEAHTVLEMNRSASNQQALQDLLGVKASGDAQLTGIGSNIHTYSPSTPIRTPQPLSPVIKGAPAATVASPGYIGTAFGAIGGIVSGFNTYANLGGQFGSTPSVPARGP
jgi:hypothetical protein